MEGRPCERGKNLKVDVETSDRYILYQYQTMRNICYHIKPYIGVLKFHYLNILLHYYYVFKSYAQVFVTVRNQKYENDVTSAV